MKPADLIARAVKREREQANLSLSALATKANLAKSTLSQIEAGQGNPSVETLWAIATALGIPFSFLFESASSESHLIRADEGSILTSDSSEFFATLLSKCPPGRRRDLYRVTLHKGNARHAAPHPQGTIEHAIVCTGTLRVGPQDNAEDLQCGDYFRYPGDIPHLYEALSETASFLLVMESIK
jgi:transcriptional regulator with XRE-family HTH domain